MIQGNQRDKSEQEAKLGSQHTTEPSIPAIRSDAGQQIGSGPEQPTGDGKSSTAAPIPVRIVGEESLKPFEQQSIALSKEAVVISGSALAESKRTTRIALWAFGAAVVAAFFVWLQYREMNSQTIIAAAAFQKAVGDSIASDANVREQLGIAKNQVAALQGQLELIKQNFVADQRPWVSLQNINTPNGVEVGSHVEFFQNLVNFGKTPALRVRFVEKIHKFCGTLPPRLTVDINRADSSVSTVMPTEVEKTEWIGLKDALTATDIAQLTSQACGLYIYSRLEYCDIFGHFHYRDACSKWLVGTKNSFARCHGYDDSDEQHLERQPAACGK